MDYENLIADLKANAELHGSQVDGFREKLAPLLAEADGPEKLLDVSTLSLALCLTLAAEVNALQDFMRMEINELERIAEAAGIDITSAQPRRKKKAEVWDVPVSRLVP